MSPAGKLVYCACKGYRSWLEKEGARPVQGKMTVGASSYSKVSET